VCGAAAPRVAAARYYCAAGPSVAVAADMVLLPACIVLCAASAVSAQAGKHTSRTFTYGKYYANAPEAPGGKATIDNSCVAD
jgi:hypothetical protein